ncbi:hypothetical protein IGI04_008097 [Brassica rapa subsp. trilocularis]|uniref:MATH domain-containing protein n=1 Tax=Brassica rapa subsp. trilocularis TaxID=1813537 RepID=A0ABQ7NLY9_BRACM|nr:hypothetical protein IGI04_008097 [Brassica rapa subsp. trilocularis]
MQCKVLRTTIFNSVSRIIFHMIFVSHESNHLVGKRLAERVTHTTTRENSNEQWGITVLIEVFKLFFKRVGLVFRTESLTIALPTSPDK